MTGPTVLGVAMAAGNLICASPPYLIPRHTHAHKYIYTHVVSLYIMQTIMTMHE